MNKLALSIGAALVMGAVGSTQAATTTTHTQKKVVELESQVAQLQQLVQQLSAQQQQQVAQQQQIAQQQQEQSVQLQQNAILALEKPNVAPKESSSKPGWMTLADGQTQLKIYGNVRVDAVYDFDGSTSSTADIYNRTNLAPLNSTNATKGALNVSAANSRLGIDLLRPTSYGDLKAKIEADFMSGTYTNGSGGFRVRHAFVELGKWTVGQTLSPFANNDTTPETVDGNGPIGQGSTRAVQVRYTQPITKTQKVLVALEGGDVDNFSGASQTAGGSRLPQLTARYDIATADKKGLVQVHGLLRENRASTNDSNDKESLGWGAGIGAKYNFTANDSIFANYSHVKGAGKANMLYANNSYTTVTSGTSFNILASELDAVNIGYGRKWNNEWRSNLILGGMLYTDDNAFAKKAIADKSTTLNKSVYNIIVNAIYTPVKNVDLGVEYTYGQRETFLSQKGDFSRLNLMAKYNF
ncbi:DcaP family trimeric outer membrane transporter [Acinetobacter boissieri]|uniref:DcaP family trimeric outer membrane transporter n=1 Tax=Acinetobacter boissieri TaxID=1219383 RepID=UPI003CC79DD0